MSTILSITPSSCSTRLHSKIGSKRQSQSLQFLGTTFSREEYKFRGVYYCRERAVFSCSVLPIGVPPLPSDPSHGSWKVWAVGMLISVILPFWRNKWGPLLKIKQEVDTVVETADMVAEIVEKVAEKVEEVADEVADHLPEGGKLKKVALIVENVARETAKEAHLADQLIDKVEDVEEKVESLFEPQKEAMAHKTSPTELS